MVFPQLMLLNVYTVFAMNKLLSFHYFIKYLKKKQQLWVDTMIIPILKIQNIRQKRQRKVFLTFGLDLILIFFFNVVSLKN